MDISDGDSSDDQSYHPEELSDDDDEMSLSATSTTSSLESEVEEEADELAAVVAEAEEPALNQGRARSTTPASAGETTDTDEEGHGASAAVAASKRRRGGSAVAAAARRSDGIAKAGEGGSSSLAEGGEGVASSAKIGQENEGDEKKPQKRGRKKGGKEGGGTAAPATEEDEKKEDGDTKLPPPIPHIPSPLEEVMSVAVLNSRLVDIDSRKALSRVCRGLRDVVRGCTAGLRGDISVMKVVGNYPRVRRLHLSMVKKADDDGWLLPRDTDLSRDCPLLMELEILIRPDERPKKTGGGRGGAGGGKRKKEEVAEEMVCDLVNDDDEENNKGGVIIVVESEIGEGGGAASSLSAAANGRGEGGGAGVGGDNDVVEIVEEGEGFSSSTATAAAAGGEKGSKMKGGGASKRPKKPKANKPAKRKIPIGMIEGTNPFAMLEGIGHLRLLRSLVIEIQNASIPNILHGLRQVFLQDLPKSLEELVILGDRIGNLAPLLTDAIERGRLPALKVLNVTGQGPRDVVPNDVQAAATLGLLRALSPKTVPHLREVVMAGGLPYFSSEAALHPLMLFVNAGEGEGGGAVAGAAGGWNPPPELGTFRVDDDRDLLAFTDMMRSQNDRIKAFGVLIYGSSALAYGPDQLGLDCLAAMIGQLQHTTSPLRDRAMAIHALSLYTRLGGQLLFTIGAPFLIGAREALAELVNLALASSTLSSSSSNNDQAMIFLIDRLVSFFCSCASSVKERIFFETTNQISGIAALATRVLALRQPPSAVGSAGDGLMRTILRNPTSAWVFGLGHHCGPVQGGGTGGLMELIRVLLEVEAWNQKEHHFSSLPRDLATWLSGLIADPVNSITPMLKGEDLLPQCCSLFIWVSKPDVIGLSALDPATYVPLFADVLLRRIPAPALHRGFGSTLTSLLQLAIGAITRNFPTMQREVAESGKKLLLDAFFDSLRIQTFWSMLAQDVGRVGAASLLTILREASARGVLSETLSRQDAALIATGIDSLRSVTEGPAIWLPIRSALWGGPREHLNDVIDRCAMSIKKTTTGKVKGMKSALMEEMIVALSGVELSTTSTAVDQEEDLEKINAVVQMMDMDLVIRLDKLMDGFKIKRKLTLAGYKGKQGWAMSKLAILARALAYLSRVSPHFRALLVSKKVHHHRHGEGWGEEEEDEEEMASVAASASAAGGGGGKKRKEKKEEKEKREKNKEENGKEMVKKEEKMGKLKEEDLSLTFLDHWVEAISLCPKLPVLQAALGWACATSPDVVKSLIETKTLADVSMNRLAKVLASLCLEATTTSTASSMPGGSSSEGGAAVAMEEGDGEEEEDDCPFGPRGIDPDAEGPEDVIDLSSVDGGGSTGGNTPAKEGQKKGGEAEMSYLPTLKPPPIAPETILQCLKVEGAPVAAAGTDVNAGAFAAADEEAAHDEKGNQEQPFAVDGKTPALVMSLYYQYPLSPLLRQNSPAVVQMLVTHQLNLTSRNGPRHSTFFSKSMQVVLTHGGEVACREVVSLVTIEQLIDWRTWGVMRLLTKTHPGYLLPQVLSGEGVDMNTVVSEGLKEPAFAWACVEGHLFALLDFLVSATARKSGLTGLDLVVSLLSSIPDLPQRLRQLIRTEPEGEAGIKGLVTALKADRRSHRAEYKHVVDSLVAILPPEPKRRRMLHRWGDEGGEGEAMEE